MITSLTIVKQLALSVVHTSIDEKRHPMLLLSSYIMVGIMFRLRRIGSIVEELSIVVTLSQTIYLISKMLMG